MNSLQGSCQVLVVLPASDQKKEQTRVLDGSHQTRRSCDCNRVMAVVAGAPGAGPPSSPDSSLRPPLSLLSGLGGAASPPIAVGVISLMHWASAVLPSSLNKGPLSEKWPLRS